MSKQLGEMHGKQVILIADDSEMNRAILAEMLGEDYEIVEAENGALAMDIIRARGKGIDLLLLDINMPELDGFQVLDMLNREQRIGDLPVIMISSESDSSFIERSYDLGASDYISRPFDVRVVRRRVVNTLMLFVKQKRLAEMVAEQVYEKERGNNLMISILSHIVEFRNGESGRHVINIRVITEILLRHLIRKTDKYGLTRADIPLICTASALHDVGKLTVPDEILNKPGRFTPEEFAIMKQHAAAGADMLKSIVSFQDEPLVRSAYEICRWHHERWDGRGYPDGLKEDEIPISAQVVAVADVYDALTSERCYKKSFPHEVAIQMITGGECGKFNPLLIECLLEVAPTLPSELMRGGNLNQTGEKQAGEVLQELFYRSDMGGPGRMPWGLDAEMEKKRFWESKAEEIRFDFDVSANTITFSDWGAKKLGLRSTALSLSGGFPEVLNTADIQAISDRLRATTPVDPEIDCKLLLSIGGELRWCRVMARALWRNDGEKCHYMGAIGKILDIHEATIMEADEADILESMDSREAASAIKQLKRVFDEVRLVDVRQAAVLTRDNEENEEEEGDNCYSIWGKVRRCANCASARALAQKTRLTKFEVVDDQIYQIISSYLELDGKPCVMEMVAHIRDGHIDEVGRDLVERLKGGNELYLDSLTGVFNRRYYDEQIEHNNRFNAVAMVDVDDFKHINDTYGHYAGDLALQAISVAMNGCIRAADVLLRYGGDEFLFLFSDIPEASFREKLKQIQLAVSQIKISSFPDITPSISVGGAYNVQPLIKAVQKADSRMYEAKVRGKAARESATRG